MFLPSYCPISCSYRSARVEKEESDHPELEPVVLAA
jgi:hypothetical protein